MSSALVARLGVLLALGALLASTLALAGDCNGNTIPDSEEIAIVFATLDIDGPTDLGLGSHLAAGDFDGDGDLDLAAGIFEDDLVVWYRNRDGAGTFELTQVLTTEAIQVNWVSTADLDGDGDLDLLSASLIDDKLAMYENLDGAGNFGPQQVFSLENKGARSIVPADVDGDGDPDALAASRDDGELAWYANKYGAGIFGPQQIISTDLFPEEGLAVDLDLDGDLDVMASSYVVDGIVWYENLDGAATFGPRRFVNSTPSPFLTSATGDLDGDGDLDVVGGVVVQNQQKLSWFEHLDGAGTFGAEQIIPTGGVGHRSIVTQDLDSDGDEDLVVAAFQSQVGWFEHLDGAGLFGSLQMIDDTPQGTGNVIVADVDADGDWDVFSGGAYIRWYENLSADCDGNGIPDDCDLTGGAPDCNANGILDECEVERNLLGDCNGNATPDTCDLAGGGSVDCASDGIPDECEPDCNGNTQADSCDILGGTSFDVDSDGIPDECETDCNGNAQPDEFDILSGASGDCDGNEIPDECDIAAGTYEDCTENLIPDVCEPDCNENDQADSCDIADGISFDENGDGIPDECDGDCDDNGVIDEEETAPTFAPRIILSTTLNADIHAADLDGDGDLDVVSASSKVRWHRNLENQGVFAAPVVIDNSSAGAVHAADVDHDGDIDLLSTDVWPGSIYWYENYGGFFSRERLISDEVEYASDVHAADLDGDGDADALSASEDDGKIAWYEFDDETGVFGPQQVIEVRSTKPRTVQAVDVDGDGDLDVMAGLTSSFINQGGATWYENLDGAGSFGPPHDIVDDQLTESVFAADVDGDGDVDVVLAYRVIGEIVWQENLDGAGTSWSEHVVTTTAPELIVVHVEDLDGDGDRDIVYAEHHSISDDDEVAWHENLDGAGTFGPKQVIDNHNAYRASVFVANLDGDGDNDVIAGTFRWFKNQTPDCNGNDKPDICDLTTGSSDVNANGILDECEPDCNGNGQPDSLDLSSAVSGDCNANTIPDECDIASGPSSDCDADGRPDECEADCNNNKTNDACDTALPGSDCDGNGVPDDCQVEFIKRIVGLGDGVRSVVAVDMDGDQDSDVLSASAIDDKIAWYENVGGGAPDFEPRIITQDPDGPSGPAQGAADTPWSVHAVDIDGDGDMDVLSASSMDDKIAYFRNLDGQGFFGGLQLVSTQQNNPRSVFGADLDGDDDVDILAASESDDTIAWYKSLNGGVNFGPKQTITNAANGALSVFAADLDGDDDNDVLSASYLDSKIAWYENLGGTFGPQQVISAGTLSAQAVVAADIDGDDDLDVLAAAESSNAITWYENLDGQGTFGPLQVIAVIVGGASAVHAADLDEDGDTDVLSAALDTVAWYENLDGGGSFGPQRVLSSSVPGASAVFAGDVDGDGDLEVLSGSYDADEVEWYANPDDEDCNVNDVPDYCDLSSGNSVDCDADDTPDECGLPLPDSDADGFCDLGDCDPADDQVWSEPWPVSTLALTHSGATTMLTWSQPGQSGATSVRYDLLRSPDGSDFQTLTSCLGTDESTPGGDDMQAPAAGALFHYLVRVENDCPGGVGTLGFASDGAPRAGTVCP